MALLKKILKNDYRSVVVKWTGSGSDTLALNSLAAASQTLTGTVSPGVTISQVSVTSSGATTVTRNSEVVLQINGNYEFPMQGSGFGAVINENQTSDIVVNLAAVGTIILKLTKTQGFSDPPY